MSEGDPAIEVHQLVKRFGRRVVVDGLDLTVPTGSVYGFLGPNGSGKTTTIRILLGLAFPTAGEVRLLGRPIPAATQAVLGEVGAVVEGPTFYPFLSGRANLRRLERVVGRHGPATERAIGEALERVGLSAAAGRPYRRYSLGMRQRLALAAALVRPRRLLVLDEPTNGLDPQGMREVRQIVAGLAAAGTTVFLSTHLLAEVEQVCTHAAMVRSGRVVAEGTVASLQSAIGHEVTVGTAQPHAAVAVLEGLTGVRIAAVAGERVRVRLEGRAPEEVNAALVQAGIPVRSLVGGTATLEDVFVALTGEGFEVDEPRLGPLGRTRDRQVVGG